MEDVPPNPENVQDLPDEVLQEIGVYISPRLPVEPPISRDNQVYALKIQSIWRLVQNQIKLGIDDAIGIDNYTTLMWAVKNRLENTVRFLLQHGASVNKKCGWVEFSPLMKAAQNGDLNVVNLLLEQKDIDVDQLHKYKETALSRACQRGHVAAAEALLSKGAKIDVVNYVQYTPLILAAEKGHSEVIRLLMDKGTNKEAKNNFGKTAFILACEMGHLNCVLELLRHGVNYNAQSYKKKTGLQLACVKRNRKIVTLLLKLHDLKVNEDTFEYAARGGDLEIIKKVWDRGFDMEDPIKTLEKAIAAAAEKGQLAALKEIREMIKKARRSLLRPTQSFNQIFIDNFTKKQDVEDILLVAAKNGQINIVDYLMQVRELYGDHEATTKNQSEEVIIRSLADYYQGGVIINSLAEYYQRHPDEFHSKYIKVVTSSGGKLHILKMLPDLLCQFDSPSAIVNECLDNLLQGIQNYPKTQILFALVIVASALKKCMKKHTLEKIDLQVKFDRILDMISECFKSESLYKLENIARILQDTNNYHKLGNEKLAISMARSFEAGPLVYCLEYELHEVLGIEKISKYVQEVLETPLSTSVVRPMHAITDIFQIRSSLFHMRSCPAYMLAGEGLSKLFLLTLMSILSLKFNSFGGNHELSYEYYQQFFTWLLIVTLFANWLHEWGELMEANFSIPDYLNEIWNYLDVTCYIMLTVWAILTFVGYQYHAWILLSLSLIPQSFCLLRYISSNKYIGILVFTIIKIIPKLMIFLLILLIFLYGFGIALASLVPVEFSNLDNSITDLYLLLILNTFEFENDDDQPNFHYTTAKYLAFIICIFYIVILTLFIAKITATYSIIDKDSAELWCMMKARQVKEFRLIHEISYWCMLPAPLNIIPIMTSLCDIWRIIRKQRNLLQEGGPNDEVILLSLSGTCSDLTLRLLYGFTLGPLLEIFLLLKDYYHHSKSKIKNVVFFTVILILSPMIYFGFFLLILYKAITSKCLIKLNLKEDHKAFELCGPDREIRESENFSSRLKIKERLPSHSLRIKILAFKFGESIPVQSAVINETRMDVVDALRATGGTITQSNPLNPSDSIPIDVLDALSVEQEIITQSNVLNPLDPIPLDVDSMSDDEFIKLARASINFSLLSEAKSLPGPGDIISPQRVVPPPKKHINIFFPNAHYYIKVKLADDIFTLCTKEYFKTTNVDEDDITWFENKEFYPEIGDETILIELWERHLGDRRKDILIGSYKNPDPNSERNSIKEWIANESYEGQVPIVDDNNGKLIGMLTINVFRSHFEQGTEEYDNDRNLRKQFIAQHNAAIELFRENDIKRIFPSTIQPTNPVVSPMTTEVTVARSEGLIVVNPN